MKHTSWRICARLHDFLGPLDRTRANDLTRDLNNLELDFDLDCVLEAARTLLNALRLNGDPVLTDARKLAETLVDSLTNLDLAAVIDARVLASELENVAARAHDELASARDRARGHAVNRVRDLDRDLPRDLACDLARYSGLADSLAVYLGFHSVPPEVKELVARSANSMPGRMVASAAKMLPASERLRYWEEYCGALYELPSWKRPAYALLVLVCARRVRKELKEPKHRVER